jgi:hypothetical protein
LAANAGNAAVTPAAGPTHEGQRTARPHHRGAEPGYGEHQEWVLGYPLLCAVEIDLRQRPVVGAARGDHHVVDRRLEAGEERRKRLVVADVEAGRGGPADLRRRPLQLLPVATQEHELGPGFPCQPGRRQPAPGAAPEPHDPLSAELPLGHRRRTSVASPPKSSPDLLPDEFAIRRGMRG